MEKNIYKKKFINKTKVFDLYYRSYLQLKHNIFLQKKSVFTWRKRLKAQNMIKTIGIYHNLLSGNINLGLLTLFSWKNDSDHFSEIYSFRRWLNRYKFKRQWNVMSYLYKKYLCREHLKSLFNGWLSYVHKKKEKIFSREQPKLFFTLPDDFFVNSIKISRKREPLEDKTDKIIMARRLLSDKPDKNDPHLWIDNLHNTSLHVAVQSCDLLRVRALIEDGHNINCINKNKQTPLHIACQNISLDYLPIIVYNYIYIRNFYLNVVH